MKTMTRLLSMLLLLALIQGCDTKAVNEPGVDIQAPKVSFLSPVSGDSISSADIMITLDASDNDAVSSIELSLDGGAPFATLTSAPWESTLPTAEISEGTHQLHAIAKDPTGNTSSATVQLRKGTAQQDEVDRMVLVEIVTSANCAPCGPANELFHQEEATPLFQQRVATIKYHVWWPRPTDKLWQHSSEWSRPRVEYLFDPNEGAPMGFVNGQKVNNRAVDWIASAKSGVDTPAGAKIELESTRTGNTINLTITVKGISTSSYSDLRLHTAVTESDIEYNDGNSELVHFDVMRRMYPSAEGESVTIPNGQTAVFQRSMEIHADWNADNLGVVVFLQSNASKEVLQAAKKRL
ncbi:MAG: Omp28-related outer membrane protein [Bacteroidetes bacterium]|nr:Omp28-related outer membrane protein [Bacteroidota bacterium]